jgi:hypothetical protein
MGVLMRHMLVSHPRGTYPRRIRRGTKERKGSKQHS